PTATSGWARRSRWTTAWWDGSSAAWRKSADRARRRAARRPSDVSRPALTIAVESGRLSAELQRPPGARALLVLSHGAGAGYRHRNLLDIGEALAARDIATLRYNFPFMEAGRRRVDPPATAVSAVTAAAAAMAQHAPDLP